MLPRHIPGKIDTCELRLQYPYALERELDSALPPEEIPPSHRWLDFNSPWRQLLALWQALDSLGETEASTVVTPATVIADLVKRGLWPAVELARREFPGKLEEFCAEIREGAFQNAPFTSRRLAAIEFAGPVWACAGAIEVASDEVPVVALRVADRYWAVASRDPGIEIGAHIEIRWNTPAIREYGPN